MTKIKQYAMLVIGFIVIAIGIISVGYVETHYTMTARVTTVYGHTVTVEDSTGNRWEFDGTGYERNDYVRLTMYNHHTDLNIYDDEIVSARKLK